MKIELLKNAFRGLTNQPTVADDAWRLVPRKRRALPLAAAHLGRIDPNSTTTDRNDLLAFAARRFDPRQLTRDDAEDLVELLHDGGALSARERHLLLGGIKPLRSQGYGFDGDAPRDMLGELQRRMTAQFGLGRPETMETESRTLAILGRLENMRARAA
jgi:hypothetical protein